MIDWFKENETLSWWLLATSIVMLIGSAVLVPVLVSRMRADYFMPDRDPQRTLAKQHPVIRWTGLIFKNTLGGLLVAAGLVLSIPGVFGQGLLTIFIGLMIMDFPGKRRLELRLIRIGVIHRSIDWIRRKAGRDPLQLPEP